MLVSADDTSCNMIVCRCPGLQFDWEDGDLELNL